MTLTFNKKIFRMGRENIYHEHKYSNVINNNR